MTEYRTALVTGASSGIGRATARRLREHGLAVHAVARDADRLADLEREIGVIPHALDLADTDALEREFAGTEVDVLANIAGASRTGNVLDASREDIDTLVGVNLTAVLQLARIVLPGMVERDLGHVVNIGSIAGHYNFFGHTAYHATKAAVHQLSRQIRNDVLGRRIRVTEISPGRVETEIFGRNLGGSPEALAAAHAQFYEGYESLTTDDVVNAIEFALLAPSHMNVGLIEIMPTFQVPGGLTFDRRGTDRGVAS